MTFEDKRTILEMRLAGRTLQEIADEIGVTRQNVSLFLNQLASERKKGFKPFKCIYPGLKEWMFKNRIGISRIVNDMKLWKSETVMFGRLNGRTNFTIAEINAILEYTGLTYEEAFGVVELPDGAEPDAE